MRVGFDIDGVFADFVWAFTKELGEVVPWHLRFGTADQQDWHFKVSVEDYNKAWELIDAIPNWWMSLNPLVDQAEINAVNFLIKNHDVYFITSRKRTVGLPADVQSKYWLDSIGVHASQASVIATQAGKKHKMINALDIEVFIDDKPDIVNNIKDHSGAISCVRLWPYNHHCRYDIAFTSLRGYAEWTTQLSRRSEQS